MINSLGEVVMPDSTWTNWQVHIPESLITDSTYAGLCFLSEISDKKQKPSVEGTVGKIATSIIARCRNDVYYSFTELKKAVSDKLIIPRLRPTLVAVQPTLAVL